MANKELKKLITYFEGTPFFAGQEGERAGEEIVELIEKAVAYEAAQPEHQAAVERARLTKAKADKADKAELEAEKLRRKSDLFFDPESGKLVDSEGNAVKVPSEEILIHQARQEKARAVLLELQVAGRRRVRPTPHFVFAFDRGDEPSRSCLTVFRVTDGLLEVVASGVDVQAEASPFGPIRDEEIAPKTPNDGSRIEPVPVTAAAGSADAFAEELRGFYRGCNEALRIVLAQHDECFGSVTRSTLSYVADAIRRVRKEG